MSAEAQQYVALVRLEYPDGRLNALPGAAVKTDHLTRGKIGLLVKMKAMMPKTEWDALDEPGQAQAMGVAYEEIFASSEAVVDNDPLPE